MNPDKNRIRFECTRCGACCREDSLLVTVTGRDICQLSIGLNLRASEVIRALDFYLVESNESPEGLRDVPAVNTEQGPAYIALRKLENGDCVFLKDNLCMIHVIRPMVCMSFPFTFSEEGNNKTWGLSAKKEICPGLEGGPYVENADVHDLAVTVLEDLAIYREFTAEWNKYERNPTADGIVERILSDSRFTA
ncbi:MAG: YkgJ family cysteine cluster protein [Candidatus Thorarchaeota archaeon]